MTQDEINTLGIAFFSGKTLQCSQGNGWLTWDGKRCPDFLDGYKWRIKPVEPKKEIWCTFRSPDGVITAAVNGSVDCERFKRHWTHLASLDREVILPEGEE